MSKCTQPRAGKHLKRYLLGELAERDAHGFEEHILSCQYCFNKVQRYDIVTHALLTDTETKLLLQKLAQDAKGSVGLLRRIYRFLWQRPLDMAKRTLRLIGLARVLSPAAHRSRTPAPDFRIRAEQLVILDPAGTTPEVSRTGQYFLFEFRLSAPTTSGAWWLMCKDRTDQEILRASEEVSDRGPHAVFFKVPSSLFEEGTYRLLVYRTESFGSDPVVRCLLKVNV